MKNFSVNTADFDSLSISGESPIVQSDLGTAPNQIPLNKDLGSLAYMNAPQIEDLNVDSLELREIAAELSDTAVDVFVYDTRKDSDGGAWRSRTSHTSWYNEELNTATRGGRREFPAVAVIVLEAGGSTEGESIDFTIYDGDDPDLPMWMQYRFSIAAGTTSNTAISALNGKIVLTARDNGILISDFVKDSMYIHNHAARHEYFNIYPSRLGRTSVPFVTVNNYAIVAQAVNDVAMTVLPNAPIDSETGLPVPTIAVATDGGVSVIRDDGSVYDIAEAAQSWIVNLVEFTENKLILNHHLSGIDNEDYLIVCDVPSSDVNFLGGGVSYNHTPNPRITYSRTHDNTKLAALKNNTVALGCVDSTNHLTLLSHETNKSQSMVNFITSTYNTGWMPGDIKLATLSDTKTETVGVDETTELVTNGGFDADSDWTKGTGWAINGGVATKTGSDNTSILQDIDTIAGKNYVVSLDIVSGTVNTGAKLYVGGVLVVDGLKDAQSISVDFVATNDSTTIAINGGSFDGGSIDNISVKQTGELITNGTFDTNSDWKTAIGEGGGSTSWTIASGTATSGPGNAGYLVQASGTVGTMITITYEVTSYTSGGLYCVFGSGNSGLLIQGSTSIGTHSITGIVTDNSDIGLYSNGAFTVDNVSARLAEDDRSVNDNGLQIFGEITKSPVAPGADLVAYSGFSANNYLMQPYNSDLDFGTGDFCVMGWFNTQQTSSNAYDDLLSVGDIGVLGYGAWSEGGLLIQNRTDNNRFLSYLSAPGGQANVSLPQPYYTPNTWNHFIIKREAGLVSVFLNGVQEGAPVEYYSNVARNNNPNWKFAIGYSGDNYVYPANNSKFALFRISATAPTAEQIAKIYRDEKVLFQDGAQATLYGTSDAVTALAYDDSDDLLHVGTASGRSAFNGLKRVDNTTTAVSTAISATEGLVIEQ